MNFCKLFIALILQLVFTNFTLFSAEKVSVTVHLHGVYESKISLIPISGKRPYKSVYEVDNIKNGNTATITVSDNFLPSEFVIRYDYKQFSQSTPYPSEQHIFIYKQNIELWVNPIYLHDTDSTYFSKDEIENTVFKNFGYRNAERKEKLGLLRNFLMKYDEPNSDLYRQCILEYDSRRNGYNKWLQEQINIYSICFVSNLFKFQYVPEINLSGTEKDRLESMMLHYFDGIDFKDSLLIRTSDFASWLDGYVNLYGGVSTTLQLRDSLFTIAGKRIIDKAKFGNPLVYGWLVDYFYKGYETNNITIGTKMLEDYINDPNCLTEKKKEINKRLTGIATLKPGIIVPDFEIGTNSKGLGSFHKYKTGCKYKLVVFWSADCEHCKELIRKLYPFTQQNSIKNTLAVFALSVDNTDTEIPKWNEAIKQLPKWINKRCNGGINSIEANDYYILSTPTMFLIDSKTNKIVSMPESIRDIEKYVK